MKTTNKIISKIILSIVLIGCIFSPTVFGQVGPQIDSLLLIKDIRTLSSVEFAGRRPGTPEHQKSVDYITDRFASLGLQKVNGSYIAEFPINDTLTGKNLLAIIPGKSEKTIVISGHYDHLGFRRGELHPGADDNASGASGLLAIAAYYADKTPNHTLLFISFDAEEMGLRGARHFVDNPPFPLERIILNINMDMISRNDENRLIACGTHHSPHLLPFVERGGNGFVQLIAGYDVPGTGRNDWTMQSDQGAFFRKNIPFIYFGVEDHPDYHTPRDTFENIQPQFFYQATNVILNVIKDLDTNLSITDHNE